MHNLSDEEMDRLSREAAEQHRSPAPPGNWDRLSALLDKEMPVADPFWKKWVWPLSDLLLLLFVFYVFSADNPEKSEASAANLPQMSVEQQLTRESRSTDDSETSEGKKSKQKAGEDREEIQATTPDEKHRKEEKSINESFIKTKSPVNKIVSPETSAVTTDRAGPLHADQKKRKENPNQKRNLISGEKNTTVQEMNMNNDNDQTGKVSEQISAVTTPLQDNQPLPLTSVKKSQDIRSAFDSGTLKEKNTQTTEPVTDSVNAAPENTVHKESAKKLFTGKKGKWEAGILYSPDFSQVGNAKPAKNGHNYGITLGYHLDARWSIQTGAVYSRKNYTAIGKGYQKVPGYNSYDPNLKVNKVQAECFMWEIPVNIRYNFLVRRSQKAFITAGVSSYFMEKEDLHYWYTYNTNPRYKAWVNEQNSSYWFSVAGISAGFEQYITPSISIQAEPFFRFTLKEVGYGYINLKTMGIFLGVKYSPPPRSSKK